jgi:hypothetical protein
MTALAARMKRPGMAVHFLRAIINGSERVRRGGTLCEHFHKGILGAEI